MILERHEYTNKTNSCIRGVLKITLQLLVADQQLRRVVKSV